MNSNRKSVSPEMKQKNPTIWESASRPLFVKSVWLDAGHRHFILDYKPTQKLCTDSNVRNKFETMQTSVYYDMPSELDEDLFLVGSSKAQTQQEFLKPKNQEIPTSSHHRLSSKNLFVDHFKRRYDFLREDAPSKQSSLQDISSVLTNGSHSDEKLAERVLNWLDLAGKTPLLRPVYEARPGSVRRKVKKEQTVQSACSKKNESVKHITIIFNKEGVPVRYNRPARNIDLCAITNSNIVARRLAGNLASARLYEGNPNKTTLDGRRPRPKTSFTRKTSESNGMGRKNGVVEGESYAMQEAKRQLHIFMPSLPKKTLISEDTICSELNSQCKINSI